MSEQVKIVMVDDEPDMCFVVQENLKEKGGFDVISTSDPKEAEGLVVKEKPDIILLDVVMPGIKGPEIVEALKNNPETKGIPIIIVSGKGEMVFNKRKDEFKWMPNTELVKERGEMPEVKSAEALAEAYGVDDYVSKPFKTDLLVQVIGDVLKRRNKAEEPDEGSEEL